MNKNFCDHCNREIDEHSGFFTLKVKSKERDFGLPLTSQSFDLCSIKCLVEFANMMRRKRVVKEVIRKEGKITTYYAWEGKKLSEDEVETKNNEYILTEDAYNTMR